MSLHAQLTPEAQKRLAEQQRNSTISSILIAVLSVLLVGVILLRYFLPTVEIFRPEIVTRMDGSKDDPPIERPELTRAVKRNPSAPSNLPTKVVTALTRSIISIPTPEINAPDPSTDFGIGGDGFGVGNGPGEGEGKPFEGIPISHRARCSKADRLDRLANNGGNEQCEEAVMKSLRWLKQTQNADGSWCSNKKVAMTGFAVLAFLGHCETPNSEEFGDAVTRALVYLVNVSMKNGGKMADDFNDNHWCYDHSIATYALAEAATFCMILDIHLPKLQEATKASGDWILEHQHTSGAWDYKYDMSGKRGGDTSIALWHIQALKACKHTGLWEENAFRGSIRNALDYIKSKQASHGGVGYATATAHGDVGFTMTGGGMLAFQMWDKSHDSLVRKGAKYIRKNAKLDYNSADADLYRHYYHAQAMMNRGGDDWAEYNKLFRDQLLNNQNADGSWKNVGGGTKVNAVAPQYQGGSDLANHYRTCLATFMLEVYYRFLPATGQK
ncbi:hypothetical protein NT6N_29890 [Oceaniferula spumae]|uniref:Squalene cyclase C-terminal domain-containing protein n=1 Tax=Oceaniferula spumae TaxID=2979115 RepID=A0AAT9FPV2_9BACT